MRLVALLLIVTATAAHAEPQRLAQAPGDAPAAPAKPAAPAPYVLPEPGQPAPAPATPVVSIKPDPAEAAAPPADEPAATDQPEEKKGVVKRAIDAVKSLIAPKPAKELFAAKKLPSLGEAMAIGYYPRGCLQGGVELPINGAHWQVMRLSRNRNWGHPDLVRYVKNFSIRAAKATGWNGILVGDLAQPRGGPAFSDHTSHQTGLDVDIWFVPMPKETLTPEQREKMSAVNLVADDWKHVNPQTYTPQHMAFVKAATEDPQVDRVLINAAIKKKMCETATGDRSWLSKVRPWYGHHDHIHVRLKCPAGQPNCRGMSSPPPAGEACGDSDFKFWFTKAIEPKKPSSKPPRALTMADLPKECKQVLAAPAKSSKTQ
ncbi:MAG: penicillin-insensitive murein endopeptidase [Pseudolabrys sp.]|nr:penicillin-insensitive murein endopeptidase [Pseudolabrys sp.]